MSLFRFSPGSCRQTCRCTRCGAGSAPRYWTVNVLEGSHRLYPARQNNLQHCVWEKYLDEPLDCGTATRIVLSLGETVGDYFWTLDVRAADGTALYSYRLDGLESVDCQESFLLNKVGGACPALETATIVPGPPAGEGCCRCVDAGGSGSSVPLAPPDNGCCLTMPAAWELEFPTPVWGNRSCDACDQVAGAFHLPYLDSPPLVGARYRYFNPHWCEDTVVPCVGGPISLEITLVFTAGCGLRAQLNLDRQLLDHEACAARCRIGYRAANFTPPRDCAAAPIALTADNYPFNPCSGRTAGGPPPLPFDTLCDDYVDGWLPPQTIVATGIDD